MTSDRDFFVDMVKTTRKQMGEVSFADAAALSEPANVWAAQTVWMRRIAATVTTELVERWSDPGRLTNLAVTPSATT